MSRWTSAQESASWLLMGCAAIVFWGAATIGLVVLGVWIGTTL